MDDDIEHARSLTFWDVLEAHAATRWSSEAVVCEDVRLDYGELRAQVDALSRALAAAGWTSQSRLLWIGQNCHRLLECVLAAARLGGQVCPANWRWSTHELSFVINDVSPDIVVYDRRVT